MNRLVAAAVFALALLPLSASAGVREDVMSGMVRCGPIQDNRAWLDCLYGAAQPMRALLGLPPAPQAGVVRNVPVERPVPQSSFGLPQPAPNLQPGPARLASYKFDSHHYFTVELADGQVWSQLKGDTNIADWTKPASSYVVRITHGAMGSYNLNVVGSPWGYKVNRVN